LAAAVDRGVREPQVMRKAPTVVLVVKAVLRLLENPLESLALILSESGELVVHFWTLRLATVILGLGTVLPGLAVVVLAVGFILTINPRVKMVSCLAAVAVLAGTVV
tara:strand:- start:135 stop:455 length:321 start_codon:yes stop_codon:yes gene_type:complete